MKGGVLITGASGFLGTQVTKFVMEQTDLPIIVLVRGADLPAARNHLARTWWDWPNLVEAIDNRVNVLNCDLNLPKLGLNDDSYSWLVDKARYIIHLAADIRLNAPLEELRRINVAGVKNLLDLAKTIHHTHGICRFSYVSTAYVAGRRKGVVPEDALDDGYGFSNNYEFSKFEAELLVRAAAKVIPVSVFRPGMVIGDSKSGAAKTFNTVYFPLRLYLTGKLRVLPVSPSMKVNIIPCDYAAEAIFRLTFDSKAEGLNFHLTLPAESLPTVREMIEFTRKWAADQLNQKLPAPFFLPLPVSRFQRLSRFFPAKSAVRSLLALAPYFEEKRVYRRDNLDRLMGPYKGNWRGFFGQILSYAVNQGFMHRSERTVHEQAYFRLSGKSRPVIYHDVIPGRIVTRSSDDIRRDIDSAVSSLKSMGIGCGDRVAVVGFNSTRYFAIDVAIGLTGGVSVPLYYSSPVRELTDIIGSCGARVLFAGVPDILAKLAEAHLSIPVVSFCREMPQCALPDNFMNWQDFLLLGEHSEISIKSPNGFGNIATLRYTSGTTGQPKGAAFTHASLRWMAETLASLPPWQARTRKVTYLSFLPMNHVVEGILASYALYYAPAPLDVYYLEGFHELQKVLTRVRPTIFFSVPRFYEKAWEKAAQSSIGRMYLGSHDGIWKKVLCSILRTAIKKSSGIGRCAQLIVGSAPVSAGLLNNYRSIGIEIHNAYGLTEAPLITLNRYMANRTDTVGQPLPDTKVCIAEDGEVLVQGPQVMKEYFQGNDSPIEDGWLHTGDQGYMDDKNHLVLCGRKKEILINSYGKNINPVKIEMLLRESSGINHVIVCCDNRPYCTALFWVSPAEAANALPEINRGILETNRQLSHPEQIKKWAIIQDELSIVDGDLTANLKMKRSAITLKYAEIIRALYEGEEVDGVSFGQIGNPATA